MDLLAYGGLFLKPDDISTAVTSAAGGRIPRPRRGSPPTDDPLTWLEGLAREALAEGLDAPVRQALEQILRTGTGSQLGMVARLTQRVDLLDTDALVAAVLRPHVTRQRRIAADLCATITDRVLEDASRWDRRLRALLDMVTLRDALLPAALFADEDHTVEQLRPWLDQARTRRALGEALDRLEVETAARLRAALQPDPPEEPVGHPARDADEEVPAPQPRDLSAERDEPGPSRPVPPAPPAPSPTDRPPSPAGDEPVVDTRELPWQAGDGSLYRIPPDHTVRSGSFVLRRGADTLHVDRTSLDGLEIDPETARQLRRRQLDRLLGVAGASDPTALRPLGEAIQRSASLLRRLRKRKDGS